MKRLKNYLKAFVLAQVPLYQDRGCNGNPNPDASDVLCSTFYVLMTVAWPPLGIMARTTVRTALSIPFMSAAIQEMERKEEEGKKGNRDVKPEETYQTPQKRIPEYVMKI